MISLLLKNLSSHDKLFINNIEKRCINMKQLITIISNYISKREIIPDEYLYEFSTEITSAIESSDTERIPDEFWQLANYVELYWRGQKYTCDDSPERIYQMGQLLSFTKMIDIWFDRIETSTSLTEYAIIMNSKYSFFKSIHDESGITHKELASRMHTSVSSLSQFVNKIQGNGFFISRPMGREKHYYLTQKGEKIYELITKRQYAAVSKNSTTVYGSILYGGIFSSQNKQQYYSSPHKLLNSRYNYNTENVSIDFTENPRIINLITSNVSIDITENPGIIKLITSNYRSEVREWSKNNLLKKIEFNC